MVTPLYFFAGAQLFDGLSWLRYAFLNGIAVSRTGYQVLNPDIGISERSDYVRACMALANRSAMNNLRLALQEWVKCGGDSFEMFDPGVRDVLHKAYRCMCTTITELEEAK